MPTTMTRQRIKAANVSMVLTIGIAGRFDFSCHQEFRKAYETAGAF